MTGTSIIGPGHLNIYNALFEHQTNADGESRLLILTVLDRLWSAMRHGGFVYIHEEEI